MKPCQPHCLPAKTGNGLHAIVQAYLDHNAESEARYLRFYAIQRTLTDAITKSALAELPDGSRFSHQRRISGPVLAQARDRLVTRTLRQRGWRVVRIWEHELRNAKHVAKRVQAALNHTIARQTRRNQ